MRFPDLVDVSDVCELPRVVPNTVYIHFRDSGSKMALLFFKSLADDGEFSSLACLQEY